MGEFWDAYDLTKQLDLHRRRHGIDIAVVDDGDGRPQATPTMHDFACRAQRQAGQLAGAPAPSAPGAFTSGEEPMADKLYGAYRGIVGSTGDAGGRGRVQVRLPWLAGESSLWAEVCRPFGAPAGAPQIGSEVLVVFEAGDLRRPIVVGALG